MDLVVIENLLELGVEGFKSSADRGTRSETAFTRTD